jgi:hypothetical protein
MMRGATVLAGLLLAAMAGAVPVVPMGPGEFVSYDDDGTAIAITLTRPYLLATYPVTVGEFMAFRQDTTAFFAEQRGRPWWPVSQVTFDDALRYANWLSERDGFTPAYDLSGDRPRWLRQADGWRLPTEAEWQYAALCGDGCWADQREVAIGPVTAAPRNDLGLAGMVDDHLEWCWDGYQARRRPILVDPVGEDPAGRRVIRGFGPDVREWAAPGYRSEDLGFRLARTPAPSAALDSLLAWQRRVVAGRRHVFAVQAVADSLYWDDRDRRDRVRVTGSTVGTLGALSMLMGWSMAKSEENSPRLQNTGEDLMLVGAGTLIVGALVYVAAGRDLPREQALARARELVAAPRLPAGQGLALRLSF